MFSHEEILKIIDKAVEGGFDMFRQGKYQEAEMIVKQTLKVSPDEPRALQLMGLIRHNTGQYQSSIEFFEKAIEADPKNAENFNNIGLCHGNLGNFDKAIASLKRGLELSPQSSYMHSNLGLQYRQTGDIANAIECFANSLKIKQDAHTWGMLGGCHGELKNLAEAERCFLKALELEPDFANAHVDLACLYHLRGEWDKAWEEYEWRFKVYDQVKFWHKIHDPALSWDGKQPLAGKRIMVYAEQGNGDAIHFFRYIRLLRERGAYVIFHVGEVMRTLFEPHVDEIWTLDPNLIPIYQKRQEGEVMPTYDYHCSLLSLPYLLKNPPVPGCPYLFTDKKINMADYSNYFKIGVVWAGNPQHPNDANRSCRLDHFRAIHDLPGVKLFSLVKDTRPRAYRFKPDPVDLAEGTADMRLVDMAPMLGTFEDTAAIINSLDLIISVDTAVLHLAGALGRPAWGLLAWNPDWRWTQAGESTIWYPGMKLYRQPAVGDWNAVFNHIFVDLKEIVR